MRTALLLVLLTPLLKELDVFTKNCGHVVLTIVPFLVVIQIPNTVGGHYCAVHELII
jgi:hypothetical protein